MGGLHPALIPAIAGASIGAVLLTLAFAWALEKGRTARARRLALILSGIASLLYVLNVYAWLIEPRQLVVRRDLVQSDAWSGPPLTIAVIGDTHVSGAHVDAPRVATLVSRVNALRPDVVILLGDYVGGHLPEEARSNSERLDIMLGLAAFARLTAPLGVVAVLGNHDSWYSRSDIQQALEEAGVAVLWNRSVVVEREGAPFAVAGLADKDTGTPDLTLALESVPEGLPVIVATHSPDPFATFQRPIALTLAAHTHCGQVTIPLLGRPIVPSDFGQRYACGRIIENGNTMIVTAGIGVSILPVRFLNPPEVRLITLQAAAPN
jgi:uncharacterized protein